MRKIALFTLMMLTVAATAQQPRSEKRGAGTNNMSYRANFEVLAPGLSWFYNWTFTAPATVANDWENLNMDYIPMIWGGGIDNEQGKEQVRNYLRQHPSIKYLLGFNEPNFLSQSRMTPKYAAAQWPHLEQLADEFGLTLVGPALNFGPEGGSVRDEDGREYTNPFDWYDTFFRYCPDCRVDHIAIHLYMPAGALQGVIDQFAEKYNRPIWLTEFNRNAGGSSTPEDHIRFLTRELEMLEKHPMIFRYAWFMTYSSVWQINLLDMGEGNLSKLGKVYTGMSSFDENYYFPVNMRIPAAHYQNGNGLTINPSTDNTNTLMLQDMSTGSWAEYQVEIPAAGSYDVNLRIACKSGSKIEIYEDDVLLTTLQPTATSADNFETWRTQSFPVQFTAGKHRIKLYSTARLFYYEWLSIGNVPEGIDQIEPNHQNAHKYLNDGQMYIQTPAGVYTPLGAKIQ